MPAHRPWSPSAPKPAPYQGDPITPAASGTGACAPGGDTGLMVGALSSDTPKTSAEPPWGGEKQRSNEVGGS